MRLTALALVLCACGPGAMPGTGRYLPMKVGNSWTYKITDSKGVFANKKSTVEALEDVGGPKSGTTAFRVRTEDTQGATVGWQQDVGNTVVRHREQSFDTANKQLDDTIYTASKLRLDETDAHVALMASFTTMHSEKTTDLQTMLTTTVDKTETWVVEAVDESVTVPAGTFKAMRVHRTGTSDKLFWFSRGVGKIKETGGGRTEELQSYTIP